MRFLKIVVSLWFFNFSVLAAELPQSSTASFLRRWETSCYLKNKCLIALHGLCCERISICKSPSAMWGPGRAARALAQEKAKQHSEEDLNAKESDCFACFGPIWERFRTNTLAWCPLHGSSPCTQPPAGWDWGPGDLAFIFLAHHDCGSSCLTLCPTRLRPLRSPKARE